jgi:poly(A) polymerase
MIRAVRFSSRFGFIIDQETQEGIIENAETLFPAVAMERVWQEFNKMSSFPRFDHALIELHRFGLLQVIFPQLQHVHLRDIKHRAAAIAHFPAGVPTILSLMELFPDASLSDQLEVCRYLRASNHDGKLVESIYRMREMAQNEKKGVNHVDLFGWVNLYTHPQSQICLEVIAARFNEEERPAFLEMHAKKKAQLWPHIHRIQQKIAALSAETLKSFGLVQGKELGDLMKEAERIAIREDLHDEASVLKVLKTGPLWQKFERGQK